jgi:hypothetical protein
MMLVLEREKERAMPDRVEEDKSWVCVYMRAKEEA